MFYRSSEWWLFNGDFSKWEVTTDRFDLPTKDTADAVEAVMASWKNMNLQETRTINGIELTSKE